MWWGELRLELGSPTLCGTSVCQAGEPISCCLFLPPDPASNADNYRLGAAPVKHNWVKCRITASDACQTKPSRAAEMGEKGRGGCYRRWRESSGTAAWLSFWALVPNAEEEEKSVGGIVGFSQGSCSKTPQSRSSRWYILTATILCVQHKAILFQALLCWLQKNNLVAGGQAGKAWRSAISIWLHSVWKKRE